jgi:hypothetical protein
MEYFETSAKNNINIQEVVNYIMDRVYENLYSKNTAHTEEDDGKQSIVLGKKSQLKQNEGGGIAGEQCKC